MREEFGGVAPWVVGFIAVLLAAVGVVHSLANLVLLDFGTMLDVLGWLTLVLGGQRLAV